MMITQSTDAYSKHTTTYSKSPFDTQTSARQPKIIQMVMPRAPQQPAPLKHTSIKDLVEKFERDPQASKSIHEGRKWVAENFCIEEGVTIRSLRLMKGWSQKRLSMEAQTSQSHIARIERGSEDIRLQTCRKLASALGIDMNTLNEALLRQEEIAQGSTA